MHTNHRVYIFCILVSSLFLYACTQPAKKNEPVKKAQPKTAIAPAAKVNVAATDTDECPRGIAEPVVNKSVFPDAQFALQPDHRTGIETLTLKDGDKLILKQSGCEYYTLSLTFETSRFAADTADVAYWGDKALLLMRQVAKGIDVPLQVDTALNKLALRLEKDKLGNGIKLAVGEEIDFGGPDPRQYLIIDRVTRLANQRYAIEVSLSYGPI